LISLERYTLTVYRAGEIDLFENLDIVHIRLLVVPGAQSDNMRIVWHAAPHARVNPPALTIRAIG
jgi:hypothetical protein